MTAIDNSYLITSKAGRRLYGSIIGLPIIDYHCHLLPEEIYKDEPFTDIGEIWLKYDHYKWRLMRSAGIDEYFITGDAAWHDKFRKYASCIEFAAGNPLYHWTRMELEKYFGIKIPLKSDTADFIYDECNKLIKETKFSPGKIIEISGVEYIATTDDAADSLEWHKKLSEFTGCKVKTAPTFRTDKLLLINSPGYINYIKRLGESAGIAVNNFDDFLKATEIKLEYFISLDCRFSDAGIEYFPKKPSKRSYAAKVFEKALLGQEIIDDDLESFLGFMFVFLAGLYMKNNITMQWHIGVRRNVNTMLYKAKGADCGVDCMGNPISAESLINMLDAIDCGTGLPKTIIYTLNPSAGQMISTIAGSYRNVVCGAAWWFCDTLRGIEDTIRNISETSFIGAFKGMVTDSRSFLSYTRHDYYRRILCNYFGKMIDDGTFFDEKAAMKLVQKLTYDNANVESHIR